MRLFSTDQPIVTGLVIDCPRQGYRVVRILMDEPGWVLCEFAKTRGAYEGNLVTGEITRGGPK